MDLARAIIYFLFTNLDLMRRVELAASRLVFADQPVEVHRAAFFLGRVGANTNPTRHSPPNALGGDDAI